MEHEREPQGTKLALILAAGELFAEHGLEGTSTRAIVEKAGANIAAINYHFGSKQELYTATLLYAIDHGACGRIADTLGDPEAFGTPQAMADAVDAFIHGTFRDFRAIEEPRWRTRLILRSMLDPSPSMEPVVKASLEPDIAALSAFARAARPQMGECEAEFWALSFMGQLAFYVLARPAILTHKGWDAYAPAFLEAAAEHMSRQTLASVGLPEAQSTAARHPAGASR